MKIPSQINAQRQVLPFYRLVRPILFNQKVLLVCLQVARTKDRPLACGEINYFRALVFLGAQLSVSLAILLTFNLNT